MQDGRWWMLLTAVLAVAAGAAPEATTTPAVSLRSASLSVKVPAFPVARDRVMTMLERHHGALSDQRTRSKPRGEHYGTLVAVIPREELDGLLTEVRGLGKLFGDSVQTRDHTGEVEMLGKRVTLLQQNAQELLGFLHSPRRMRGSDILFVQHRLYQTRLEIAQAEQMRANLLRGAGRSTVSITLFEDDVPGTFDGRAWLGRQWHKMGDAFLGGFRTLANLLLFFIASWPIWLMLIFLTLFALRLGKKWRAACKRAE